MLITVLFKKNRYKQKRSPQKLRFFISIPPRPREVSFIGNITSGDSFWKSIAKLAVFVHDKRMKNKKDEKVRLNKFIAQSGLCSRRKADELIESGVVKVNGKTVSEMGFLVSKKDVITVNNKPVKKSELTYIKYYKPAGYITTSEDEKGRKTIYDLLPEEVRELKPVGRLDKDSTGLLIMTNDGDLINKLTHPSVKIPKIYRVSAEGKLNLNDLETLAKGIEIEKGKIAYADAMIVEYEGKTTVLQITLYQGLNRQIRKMLDYIGHPVIALKRVSHGTINIQGMKKGQFKYIKPKEIRDLLKQLEKAEKAALKNKKDKE